MFSNQIEHAVPSESMTVSHMGGVRTMWRDTCLLSESECVSRVEQTSTRKRNNYINQFSKNKRMINYMKALDVIAAATTAGAACQSFSRDRSHSLWYLRFLVRRRHRYHYCSLLTKSTVRICFCAAFAHIISSTRLHLRSSGKTKAATPITAMLVFINLDSRCLNSAGIQDSLHSSFCASLNLSRKQTAIYEENGAFFPRS